MIDCIATVPARVGRVEVIDLDDVWLAAEVDAALVPGN